MAITGQKKENINSSMTGFTTETPAHADNFNDKWQQLLDNDVTLDGNLMKSKTATHTQNLAIGNLPANSVEGGISGLEYEGMTLVNSVKNGDFSDGTTGWAHRGYGDITAVNNELIQEILDSGDLHSASRIESIVMPNSTPNTKYFLYGQIKPKHANVTYLTYGAVTSVFNPNANEWSEVYGVTQSSSVSPFRFYHKTDTNYVVTDTISRRKLMAINMTALGIEDYTEEQMLSLVQGGYFEGIKSVENPVVETVGKNLLPTFSNNWEIDLGLTSLSVNRDSLTIITEDNNGSFRNDSIRLSQNTNYNLDYSSTDDGVIIIFGTNDFINFTSLIVGNGSFNTQLFIYYRVILRKATAGTTVFTNIQLEKGSTVTSYEPYKSSKLQIEAPLRRLPNGVTDRIYESNGEIWLEKNVEEYVLQESDITDIVSTAYQFVLFSKEDDYKYYNVSGGSVTASKAMIVNGFNSNGIIGEGNLIEWDTTRMAVGFPLGTYPDLSEAQADLIGTVVQYQLTQPELTNLTQSLKTLGQLSSYENGSMYLSSESGLFGSLTCETPTNKSAIIEANADGVQKNSKSIQGIVETLDLIQSESIDFEMDNESIKSLPTGSVNGSINNLEYNGLTLVNSVVNGDFSDGVTGWDSVSVTGFTSINRVGQFTATAPGGRILQRDNFEPGDVIFGFARIKGSNVFLKYYDGAIFLEEIQILDDSKFSEISFINTIISNLSGEFQIRDERTSGFSLIEVDDCVLINMTALGIEDYTEEQMLDLVRGGYFEGIKSVENPVVETVGKNLFDKNTSIYGEYVETDGNVIPNELNGRSDFITIETSTSYTVSNELFDVYRAVFYDSNKNYISGVISSLVNSYTFVTPSNAKYCILSYGLVNIDSIQLEKGSTATSYEPYKSSKLQIEAPLRRLPNGVADRMYESNGEIWLEKNVEEYVLQESDVSTSNTSLINNDLYGVFKSVLINTIDWDSNSIVEGKVLNSKFLKEVSGGARDLIGSKDSFYTDSSTLYFIVEKGTYTNLTEAQTALAGTKIQYQLAQPELINLTSQLKASGLLESYENGTMYLANSVKLVNEVVNGDFSDGTTGWITLGGANYNLNGSILEVSNITSQNEGISTSGTLSINKDDKVFSFARVKASSDVRLHYSRNEESGSLRTISSHSGNGEYEDLYGIYTPYETLTTPFLVISTRSAPYEDFEVDGELGVFTINMTQLGIENLSEQEMLELVRKGYFKEDGPLAKADYSITGEFKADIPANQASRIEGAVAGVNANAKQIANVQDVVNLIIAGL